MTAPDPKYGRVRIEAVQRCEACRGDGRDGRTTSRASKGGGPVIGDGPCPVCDGVGERRTPILNEGEPFFLVRGQDMLAEQIVAIYGLLFAKAHGRPVADWPADLERRLDDIRAWQAANPGLVKKPD